MTERSTVTGGRRLTPVLAIGGIVALALALGVSFLPTQERGLAHFLHAYLLNFTYFLSLSLGALFFVIIHHLARAGWSVVVRRLAEVMMATLPYWVILFLPILILVLAGNGDLYQWNDASRVAEADLELLHKKAPYLNGGFFAVRAVIYMGVWTLLSLFFWRKSLRQDDDHDKSHSLQMQRWSGPAVILFSFTVAFASFDWLMSLDWQWFSTIYGVYFFGGSLLAFFAALAVSAVVLQQRGDLREQITPEHYHDIGKYMFGFVVFWAYIGFSQYMLIWYANIPEETIWYLHRQTGTWLWISLLLLFGHFFIPFAGLLSRSVKRNRIALAGWAGWLLLMHWVDLYWLIMPEFSAPGPIFGLIDLLCVLGMGGVYLAVVLRVAGDRALIPVGDPRLPESLAFKNI